MIAANRPTALFLSQAFLFLALLSASFFFDQHSVLYGFITVLLLLAVFAAHSENFLSGWKIPKSHTVFLIFTFWIWMVLTLLWSDVPYTSTYFFFIISTLPLVFFGLSTVKNSEKFIAICIRTLKFSLCLLALWALTQFFFFYETFGPRIHHPFLNPNSMAALLNVGCILVIGSYFSKKIKDSDIGALLLISLFTAALLTTQSRSALCIMILTIAALVPSIFIKSPEFWRKIGSLFLAMVLAAAALYLYHIIFHTEGPRSNFQATLLNIDALVRTGSLDTRLALWKSSFELFLDHFWTGIGLGNFRFHYPAIRALNEKYSYGFFVHMDPLQFGIEIGVVALLLFYAILASVLWKTIQSVKVSKDHEQKLTLLTSFFTLLAVCVHTHFSFHLYIPAILMTLGILLASWHRAAQNILDPKSTKSFLVKIPQERAIIFIGALFILYALWPIRVSIAQYYMSKTTIDSMSSQAQENLRKAQLFAPASDWQIYERKADILSNKLNADLPNLPRGIANMRYTEILSVIEKGQERNPYYHGFHIDKARLYFLANNFLITNGIELAIKELEQAISKNPFSILARLRLSDMYLMNGDVLRAEQVVDDGLERVLSLDPLDVLLLEQAAKIKLRTGNKKDYILLKEKAERRSKLIKK